MDGELAAHPRVSLSKSSIPAHSSFSPRLRAIIFPLEVYLVWLSHIVLYFCQFFPQRSALLGHEEVSGSSSNLFHFKATRKQVLKVVYCFVFRFRLIFDRFWRFVHSSRCSLPNVCVQFHWSRLQSVLALSVLSLVLPHYSVSFVVCCAPNESHSVGLSWTVIPSRLLFVSSGVDYLRIVTVAVRFSRLSSKPDWS